MANSPSDGLGVSSASQPPASDGAGASAPPTSGNSPAVSELIDRLTRHRVLGTAPRSELEWLAVHGRLERHLPGSVLSSPTLPVTGMFILFSGRISLHMLRGNVRHKVAEWHEGDVTGLLPYSRLVNAPGDTVVDETAEMLVVPRDRLQDMTRACHEVTSLVVHVMLDRTRFFTSSLLHDEKLKSLGRLAAGLAHELNNPAAAITRFAKVLPEALAAAESATEAMARASLQADEAAAVRSLSADCRSTSVRHVRSPIEEAEREDEIAEWLAARGMDASAAEAIAESPITILVLERLANLLRGEVLEPALRWIAADCSVRSLASQIEHAGTRISDLVTAVRGFTRVDASTVPQPVDIGEGLGQTLAVLAGKARGKAIRMAVTVEDGLPPVRGLGAELNQVWSNLIDNALDAAPQGGNVTVSAARKDDCVVVRVADDGGGITPEIRERIFDPFFTTKDVGKGTGLGLDIVRRLVERHDGDIDVSSEPGRTVFSVSLPVAKETSPERLS
jgi:signal transduction histidine kinase